MNLWAKRNVGQLAVLAVALFFFSCADDTSLLGFRNPNPKFKISYVEIPIDGSVVLLDSLITSNRYQQGETNRFLVGKYSDPQFGEVTAAAYSQFFTTNTTKTFLSETAVFDSISMDLKFDLYTYGAPGLSPQTISIYELDRELQQTDSSLYYFNKTSVPLRPATLGSKSFSVDDVEFKEYIEEKKDTTIRVHIPLDFEFGARIFSSAMRYRNSSTPADSSFARFKEFVKEFKGIAIVPDAGDKVVGFSPASTASLITLHYHDAANDSLKLNLAFAGTLSYNKIGANRSSTPLANLTEYAKDFFPAGDMRYVQAGTGVLTKLDFSQFYKFADADTNTNVIINSAELVIDNFEPDNEFPASTVLSLRALNNNNNLEKLSNATDTTTIQQYKGFLTNSFAMVGEGGEAFALRRSADGTAYSGFMTLFAQQLFYRDPVKPRYNFAVFPEIPQIGKSVNRLMFHKNNVKLKIYYTRPTFTDESKP